MDDDERMASWHLVAPDGTVTSGGRAAAPMLRLLPGGGPLAAAFDRAPNVVERAYDWVNRNRGTLGQAITDRARERADRMIASRAVAD